MTINFLLSRISQTSPKTYTKNKQQRLVPTPGRQMSL